MSNTRGRLLGCSFYPVDVRRKLVAEAVECIKSLSLLNWGKVKSSRIQIMETSVHSVHIKNVSIVSRKGSTKVGIKKCASCSHN